MRNASAKMLKHYVYEEGRRRGIENPRRQYRRLKRIYNTLPSKERAKLFPQIPRVIASDPEIAKLEAIALQK